MVEEELDAAVRDRRTIADRFRVEGLAGRGASGTVYRATDLEQQEIVALKLVPIERDEQDLRFEREAAALAEITHPGVVRYVDHGVCGDDARLRYLAMEWLEGVDLRARLIEARRGGAGVEETRVEPDAGPGLGLRPRAPLSAREVVTLGRGVAAALASVHRVGLVHRDIKPSNILLVDGAVDRPKLVDFGVARLAAGALEGEAAGIPGLSLTKTGAFVGTPLYMSPEQARTESAITAATDVWSLGAVLYECLSGVAPFSGQHFSAVLARILLEDPAPLRDAAGSIPAALERAILRMLDKRAAARPQDGAAALALLEAVGEVSAVPGPGRIGQGPEATTQVLTTQERRINCVLFARPGAAGELDVTRVDHATEVDLTDPGSARPGALEEVRRHGKLELLADGALMLVPHARNPKDQAIEAARAALALARVDPSVAGFVAMGRSEGARRVGVGALLDRAVGALAKMGPGELRVDEAVARLVDGRFELAEDADWATLCRELDAEERRLLLGRPTRAVGRRRELGLLSATWEEVAEDAVARAILLVAPAGAGKSRLRWEFVRSAEAGEPGLTKIVGQGDSLSAGSPFGLLAPALRRWFGIAEGEASVARQGKVLRGCAELLSGQVADDELRIATLFLGELVGAAFDDREHPALAAARRDPMLRGQNMGEALVAWLAALTRRGPVLVVLEDLHWGDAPSIQIIDQALRRLDESPLMVLATARPEVHELFPRLWQGRALQTLSLDPLTGRACRQLVDQVLGDDIGPALRDQIVARCQGNALYLEELIRAAALGEGGAVPETVLGMVEARLDALGPGPKQILRAAAVFGESFWSEGVAALLRGVVHREDVRSWLEELTEAEVIRRQPSSELPGQRQFRFHHALVRDAAYSTMVPTDRGAGHRAAGHWLVAAGASDPLVLAGHFDRGDDPEHAASWYEKAASHALEGGDLAGVRAHVNRALQLAPHSERRGALRALEAVAAYWQSDYAGGKSAGLDAVDHLTPGCAAWFRATGTALVSCARLADDTGVKDLFATIQRTPPARDAHGERLIAMCRGAFQLVFAGRFDEADPVLAQIAAQLDADVEIDALTRAQAHHVQGVRAAHVGDVARFLHHLERALEAFEAAGDRRNVALERTTVAWCFAELGLLDRAESLCRESLAHCEQSKATQAITYAKVNLGYVLALRGEPARGEARAVLLDAVEACRAVGNLRLEGWARAHLSAVEHDAGAHALELEHADAAVELLGATPGLRAWALACRARARLALADHDRALADVEVAMQTLNELGGLLQGESLPPLVRAQILATMHDSRADDAAGEALRRLHARAERLGRPAWRASFLEREDSRATLALDPGPG